GQLKYLFSWNLNSDSESLGNGTFGDGLPDWWEMRYFGNLARDGTGDFDGDSYTDLQEYTDGSDPTTAEPLFDIINVSGNNQICVSGKYTAQPLVVRVIEISTGLPLVNTPVLFSVDEGNGDLDIDRSLPSAGRQISVMTNDSGYAQAYYRLNVGGGTIIAAVDSVETESDEAFYITEVASSNDSDGDGLSTDWELEWGIDPQNAYSLDLTNQLNDGAHDSDSDGMINAVEMHQLCNPFNKDTDGDSMEDEYERYYGLRPTQNIVDPQHLDYKYGPYGNKDNDSLTNVAEFHAGSLADSNGEQPRLSRDISLGLVYVKWFGVMGSSYSLLKSATPLGPWVEVMNTIGANTELTYNEPIGASGFFKVISNHDSDLDGLPDSWEQQIINAGLTDQNGDGLVNLLDVLPEDDFDQDLLTNRDEYIAGTHPLVDQTVGSPASYQFSYDVVGRLGGSGGPLPLQYHYDNAGNLEGVQ
ncbi:MAG: hypothetical protein HC901_01270, partial [Bdellovibrionaceae bacterium]|nr:hypothetical protein [Pseudobdellovibrionaceae bacterium]